MRRSYEEAFWALVDKSGDCWIWSGAKRGGRRSQYGNFRGRIASRVSWEIANKRPFPDGLYALHKCDNPACVNPDHIFLGTIKDNAKDMMRKLRKKTRLTWETAEEIRQLCAGGMRQSEVAAKHGLCRATVCLVVNGKQWVST